MSGYFAHLQDPIREPGSLRLAQFEFQQALQAGDALTCPVCERYAKISKRKINSGMAAALCWMVKAYDEEWLDVPNTAPRHVLRSNQHTTLELWGLVERKPNDEDPTKKHLGLWRPTKRGVQFARNMIKVESHVFIYNNKRVGASDTLIGIRAALADKFDYEEIIGTKCTPAEVNLSP